MASDSIQIDKGVLKKTIWIAIILVATLVVSVVTWRYQVAANEKRAALRAQIDQDSETLGQIEFLMGSVDETIRSVAEAGGAVEAAEVKRRDAVFSATPDLDTIESAVTDEQAALASLQKRSADLLGNMRSLTSTIEARGVDTDTRSLRSSLDQISSSLAAGVEDYTRGTRMIADNLRMIRRYGIFAFASANSPSDIGRSYENGDHEIATVVGRLPSFRDSAARFRSVLESKRHAERVRYRGIRGPLDSMFGVPPLPALSTRAGVST